MDYSTGGGGGGSWGGGGTIYAFNKAQYVPDKNAFYSIIQQYEDAGYSPKQIADQFSNNPFGISYQELFDGSSQRTTSTGSGVARPAFVSANLSDKLGALNQLYDLIYGDLNNLAQTRKSDLEKQYGEQRGNLQKQYEKNQAILPNAFVARGTRYSSDYENAARDAADTYNTNLNSIQQDQDAKMAQVGQQYQSALSGYQAARSNLSSFNPNFYGSQQDLDAVRGQLDQQANNLSAERSKLMTDSQYRNTLNTIAPTQNMGASALQEQLAKITNSSIPGYAKDTIAQGLIKQSGEDPNYYTDYYEKLKGGLSTPLQ